MRRGFTLVELVVVLSVMAIITPITWKFLAKSEDQRAIGAFHLRVADAAATVSEQLALDRRAGEPIPGEALAWRVGPCEVRYRIEAGVLQRVTTDACGGALGLARNVERFTPEDGGVELVFSLPLRPDRVERVRLFLAVPR